MNQVKKLNKWRNNDKSIKYSFKICSSIWKELFLKIKQVKLINYKIINIYSNINVVLC